MSSELLVEDAPVQERRVVTPIPGPLSRQLLARKTAEVSAGIGVALPAFIARAGGGILVDVDGNHLIDLGSGVGVTVAGNANPRVVAEVTEQASQFTHTAFFVTPYEGYVEVCAALNRLTPGSTRSGRRCSAPAARQSRTPSRSPGCSPAGRRSSCSSTATTGGQTSRWG